MVEFDGRLRCRNGSYKWVAWNTAPDAGGGLAYCVGREMAERRGREEALRDSDRRKGELLHRLSRELRNPLAPIRNSLFLLEHSRAGTMLATRAFHVLKSQTERFVQVVEDLLPLTREDAPGPSLGH